MLRTIKPQIAKIDTDYNRRRTGVLYCSKPKENPRSKLLLFSFGFAQGLISPGGLRNEECRKCLQARK